MTLAYPAYLTGEQKCNGWGRVLWIKTPLQTCVTTIIYWEVYENTCHLRATGDWTSGSNWVILGSIQRIVSRGRMLNVLHDAKSNGKICQGHDQWI